MQISKFFGKRYVRLHFLESRCVIAYGALNINIHLYVRYAMEIIIHF